jgi:hypothetical protein
MSDEQQIIRDLAREFITQRGDELWKMCCEHYKFSSADTRKQNAVMIGAFLGFQMALQTSLSLAKIKEEANDVPSSSAETATQAN